MTRFRKIWCILICAILLTLTACASHKEVLVENDIYTIYVRDGNYTLILKEPFVFQSNGILTMDVLEYPVFNTFAEMKQAILAGDFTTTELYALQQTSATDDGNIEICDINRLYRPTVPTDMVMNQIVWLGKSYNFRIDAKKPAEDNTYYRMSYLLNEDFDRSVKEFTQFTENDNIEIISTATDASTGGTVYFYRTSAGRYRAILYTLTEDNKQLHVLENYYSDSVPRFVNVWGTENGVHFSVTIGYPQKRPTVEWLLSFGLTPYVENMTTS